MVVTPDAESDGLTLIRKALLVRLHSSTLTPWARIERHFVDHEARGSDLQAGPRTPPASGTRIDNGESESDAAFWKKFQGQLEIARQNLPNGAIVLSTHSAEAPMDVAALMQAARLVPPPREFRIVTEDGNLLRSAYSGEPSATRSKDIGFASISPSSVDEASCYWLGVQNSKRKTTGSEEKHITPTTVPGGGKRRRRRTNAASAEVSEPFKSTPPKKSPTNRSSAFFSPGQQAAQSLLALRHAVS